MAHKLKRIFSEIGHTHTQQAIRAKFIDVIGSYFQSQRWGIYLYGPNGTLASVDVHGIRNVDTFVEQYQKFGAAVDPVLQHVQAHHMPAHEGLFYSPSEWKQSPLYQSCCATQSHAHFMTGPLVGSGQMIGAVYFSRLWGEPAFNRENLRDLGAVCAHLSAQLASVESSGAINAAMSATVVQTLTPRELQIAHRVAKGMTNAEISQDLWITENTVKQALKKIFRKLNVRNRAAMVAIMLKP
ncbi:MAG: LuxR C-terminal-related transcriptional regulator [Phormidesmis sp.]